MPRHTLAVVGLFAVSFAGFFGSSYLGRSQSAGEYSSGRSPSALQPGTIAATQQTSLGAGHMNSSPNASSDDLDRWLADANGDDFAKRGPAIMALANAPRAQALPALQRALSTGTAADRELSIAAMRTLALHQGDGDEAIRNAFRQTVYHADSDALTQAAQSALDDVEAAVNGAAPITRP